MEILDGIALSRLIKSQLKQKTGQRISEGKNAPHLAAILVGNNPASETYVSAKIKACEETGYKSSLIRLEDSISESRLLEEVQKVNDNSIIDGLIVQLPLPKHINVSKIIES